MMNPIQSAEAWTNRNAPFGKFERFTAGVCMAIPFFMIIVEKKQLWWLLVPFALTFFITYFIPLLAGTNNDKDLGRKIAVRGSLLLFVLYLLFPLWLNLESLPTISAYVTMDDRHIFGMLLTAASMLFIANGVLFWQERKVFPEARWRSGLNITLGVLLLGVIIFRCDKMPGMHNLFAFSFFIGCGVSSVARKSKDTEKWKHRAVDFIPLFLILLFFLDYVALENGWEPGAPWDWVNLFGVESIALWITGFDFILVSLKRDREALSKAVEMAREKVTSEKGITGSA